MTPQEGILLGMHSPFLERKNRKTLACDKLLPKYMGSSQFARVVKGVDLRSTAGNCAWARTPQLTFRGTAWFGSVLNDSSDAGALQKQPHGLRLRLLTASPQPLWNGISKAGIRGSAAEVLMCGPGSY